MKKQKLVVLDLFSGIGGFSLGLQKAGFKTIAFCEIEEPHRKVLTKHWPRVPIAGDVTKLTYENNELIYNGEVIYNGKIDLICGGFPCQDISIAGKNAGIRGAKSGLWAEFQRLIGEVNPKYAIIENVSALLSRGLNVILNDLAEVRYDATWTTLDTKYFGLPHRRRRVYILAVRDGIKDGADIFKFDRRLGAEHRQAVGSFDKGFKWNFAPSNGFKEAFAFFTRQRSDEFAEAGLSSTIMKRDFKDFTDVVVSKGRVRRVIPSERLMLQGIPSDWLDGLGLSNNIKFSMNGMSVPVVEWLGNRVMEYDNV